jgi:hypothetical protein
MHTGKKLFIAAVVFLGILLSIYLGGVFFYQSHFLYGSTVNGITYSNQTVAEVETDIENKISAYTLTLVGRNDVIGVLAGGEIGYHYVKDDQIALLQSAQNPYLWPVAFLKGAELSMEATTTYDSTLLEEKIRGLPFFKEENNIPPENASIVYDEAQGFIIQPEKENSLVKETALKEMILVCLEEGALQGNLEDYDCYEVPEYTSNSPELMTALEEAKKYTDLTITYTFGSRSEVLDKSTLHDWITISDDFSVSINEDKVTEYISYLNYYYTTFGISRQFTKQNGETITIKGGDYGWWINKSAEAKELLSILKAGQDVTREPVYYQTAASREEDDIGNSYVEVSLDKQKLWLFIDGELIMESDIVTGNLRRNYGTPTGVYGITYKERDATLVGENYSSPVSYWMPFNGNIGFHDASWRSKFGKEYYKTSGSHGCVNMPPAKAAELYEYVTKGMPVIVY